MCADIGLSRGTSSQFHETLRPKHSGIMILFELPHDVRWHRAIGRDFIAIHVGVTDASTTRPVDSN
eukprot:594929-Pyramimonas_sp.AAC.1